MRVRDKIRSSYVEVKAAITVSKDIANMTTQVFAAIDVIWNYLDSNKEGKIPASYDMLFELFGSFDRKLLKEVLTNAVHSETRRRIGEALEDCKKGYGGSSRQLENKS